MSFSLRKASELVSGSSNSITWEDQGPSRLQTKGLFFKNDANCVVEASPSLPISSRNLFGIFMISQPGFPAWACMVQLIELAEQDTGDAPKCLFLLNTLLTDSFKDLWNIQVHTGILDYLPSVADLANCQPIWRPTKEKVEEVSKPRLCKAQCLTQWLCKMIYQERTSWTIFAWTG